MLVASFGALLAFLDATIVNVAFPDIKLSFPESSIESLSWVLNAYNVVFAAFLVAAGRFADLFGRRRMFTSGIVIFTLASALCAASSSLSMLIAARAIQAVGAAVLVPASLALVIEAFPPARRSHAVGLWGATAAAAAGLGPPLGGALVELWDWRLVFLINLPLGIAGVALAGRVLVESRAPGRRTLPDIPGALLLAVAVALLTLGIVQGNDWGWTSAAIVLSFAGALAAATLFVVSSRRHPVPILDPKLLRIRSFTVANAVTFVAGMGFYAYLLNNILWLNYVWGWSLLAAGLAVAPGAVFAAVAAGRLGRLADERGARAIAVGGSLVWAGAYLWYATQVGAEPQFWSEWLPGQVLSGIGVGATLPIVASAAVAAVPGGRYATASSVVSSARQLGGVIGIALLVVIVGTPAPATLVDRLRDGWYLSATCFLLAAGGALLLRREHTGAGEEAAPLRAPRVDVRETPARVRAVAPESLLHRLPDRLRQSLLADAEPVALAAGQWLFEEGGAADAVYVVTGGRLEVVAGNAVLREVGPDEVVGELAVLAGGTRSAGVRARRDSRILRIRADGLTAALERDAEAQRAMTAALAAQLQRSRGLDDARPAEPKVISVVGASARAPVAEVARVLVDALGRHVKVAAPGRVDVAALDGAERESDRVVLAAAPGEDEAWRAFCLRQADRVVLVGEADAPPPELAAGRPAYVLLVGDEPPRAAHVAWHDAVEPRRVFTARREGLGPAVATMAARLAGASVGLALAGGGARAFAAVGVLHELEDAGVEIDRIAGTSLGGIVAAFYATGRSAAGVDALCYEEFVRRNPLRDYTIPRVAIARGRRAEAALERRLGDAHFEELPRELALVSTDLLENVVVVHRRGLVREALRASFSLPGLFPPARIDRSLHVDGGVLDNLPVAALQPDEGPIVAVNIGAAGGLSRRAGPPRMPTLGETMLRSMLMGSAAAIADAREQAAIVVTPDTRGIGLLEFHQLDRAVEAGRAAGRAAVEALASLRDESRQV